MCITWCHSLSQLYWNHDDCAVEVCPFVSQTHPPCASCRHHSGDGRCGLTRAPLPAGGQGCCHFDVVPQSGRQRITRQTLVPLGIRPDEPAEFVLVREGVPFERNSNGELWVDIDTLNLPFTYGAGTDQLPEEPIDWSDWLTQWACED